MEKKKELIIRLHDILDRHVRNEDYDLHLVDRELVRLVVSRSEAEYKKFLVDVME